MAKRVKREEFPCKQWYQNPSQYYKLLVVKVVWADALLTFIEKFITHTSPYKYFQPSLLNKNTKVSQGAIYLVYSAVKLGLVN